MSRARAIAISAASGAVAAIVVANVAFAQSGVARGGGFGGDGFGRRHRSDGFVMMLPILVLVVLAVLAGILLWRSRQTPTPIATTPPASPTFNAQAILAERLARGEISPDDYRAAIAVLRETPPPPPPVG